MSVRDYAHLSAVPHREGVEVTVDSSGFVYRSANGRWVFVRRTPLR